MQKQTKQAKITKYQDQPKADPPKDFLTPPQIAKASGIGLLSIYAFLESGALPGTRVGNRWYISVINYRQWLSEFGRRPAA
jgi:hypothetical protein